MNTYYKTSADYHDALDRMEARERAERADVELDEQPEQCRCLEYAGDDPKCPVHGWMNEQEGSDTSMGAQLNDAGYGCGGIF